MNNPLGNYTTLLKSLHQPQKNIQGQSIEANNLQSVCQYVKFVGYICCSILVSAPISSAPVTGSPVGSPPPGPVVWLRLTAWCVHSRGAKRKRSKIITEQLNLRDLPWRHVDNGLNARLKLYPLPNAIKTNKQRKKEKSLSTVTWTTWGCRQLFVAQNIKIRRAIFPINH